MQLYIHIRYLEYRIIMFTNLCINRRSGLDKAGELGGTLGVVSGEMSGKTS